MYMIAPGKQPRPGTQLIQRVNGMGCACNDGLGLFDSGADFSQWGGVEWTLVGVGAFALLSMFSTAKRGATGIRKSVRRRSSRRRKAQQETA